jgi:hypothetical protein
MHSTKVQTLKNSLKVLQELHEACSQRVQNFLLLCHMTLILYQYILLYSAPSPWNLPLYSANSSSLVGLRVLPMQTNWIVVARTGILT